jgi:hypothetical protein
MLLCGRIAMSSDRCNGLPKLLALYATLRINEASAGRLVLSTSVRVYYNCHT